MGRKRHIITDTLGLMLFAVIHAADIQDRDGAPGVLKATAVNNAPISPRRSGSSALPSLI
jgi:transposase